MQSDDVGRLLISCPDQPGIVAAVSDFLFVNDANIIHSDQAQVHYYAVLTGAEDRWKVRVLESAK